VATSPALLGPSHPICLLGPSAREILTELFSAKIATVWSGEVELISGEFEAVHLNDPERACLSE